MGELAAPFAMSLPAVSRHLKVLERAGLIARGREAQWRPCRLEPEPLREVAGWLETLPPALGGELRPPRRLSPRPAEGKSRWTRSLTPPPAPTTRRSASSAGWRRRASWSSPPGPSRATCAAGARRTASTFRVAEGDAAAGRRLAGDDAGARRHRALGSSAPTARSCRPSGWSSPTPGSDEDGRPGPRDAGHRDLRGGRAAAR